MSADPATQMNADVATDAAPLFVINLCASTSPMALTQPNTAELKRYTFFVSRQREDGRERFRLHMGYFGSQEDAESLLAAVRDVYPAAWAGPAPTTGVPRRARMSVTPKATVAHPMAPAAAPHQALPVAPPVALPAALPVAAAVAAPVAVPVAAVAPPAPVAEPPRAPPQPAALEAMSNVRDVLAQLSEETPPAPAAVAARVPTPDLDASQTLRVLESAPVPAAATPAPRPNVAPVARAAAPAPPKARISAPAAGEGEVRIVTPEDTQTLTDIRLDAQNNAPPCFAVQLVWAVAPIDVAILPHLAIFDAYTLYNVEGSRQGRKWFGLRLGFFSDPNSATQVAHYVRSDYPAVAIVPVASRERDHAKGGNVDTAPRAVQSPALLRPETSLAIEKQGLDGFELLPDDAPRAPKRDVDDIAPQQAAAAPLGTGASAMTAREKIAAAAAGKPLVKAAASPAREAPARPVGKSIGKRVMVRKRPQSAPAQRAAPGAPNPLESTLEILGASTLTLDESREIMNDSAIRKPIEKKAGSRFSKLLNRLSGG